MLAGAVFDPVDIVANETHIAFRGNISRKHESHVLDELKKQTGTAYRTARKLWLDPLTMGDKVIGPVPVPVEVAEICRKSWDIFGAVVKTSRGWRFLEVWSVSP